jgi:SAM-dependent methyltransferase
MIQAPIPGAKDERTAAAACTLCGQSARTRHDRGDRRIVKCAACDLVFVDPMPTLDEKAEIERRAFAGDLLHETVDLYTNYGRKFEEDGVVREFRAILSTLVGAGAAGRILDVGPGTGLFLHLAADEHGLDARGIDVSAESADKATQEFGLPIDVGDFETFDYVPGSFGSMTMLDVLEHSTDPVAFLRRALELLAPAGCLYVAVPNQRSLMTAILDVYMRLGGPFRRFFLERLYVEPHVYYFSPRSLALALERAGFELVRIRGANVQLGRYKLALWMRLVVEAVLRLGGLLGMSAKIHALARKPGDSQV